MKMGEKVLVLGIQKLMTLSQNSCVHPCGVRTQSCSDNTIVL